MAVRNQSVDVQFFSCNIGQEERLYSKHLGNSTDGRVD